MPRIIAIANQKGGSGKTTTAVNLGAALAERGKQVLLVDLDPQVSLSATFLGEEVKTLEKTIHDLLLNRSASVQDFIIPTTIENVYLIPSTVHLTRGKVDLDKQYHREQRLKSALLQLENIPDYSFDYVIIDCPADSDILTVNALVVADHVIVPLRPNFYDVWATEVFLMSLEEAQEDLNPNLTYTMLLTQSNTHTRLGQDFEKTVRESFGDKLHTPVVPRSVRVEEQPGRNESILSYDTNSPVAEAYRQLAQEIDYE